MPAIINGVESSECNMTAEILEEIIIKNKEPGSSGKYFKRLLMPILKQVLNSLF